MRGKPSPDSSRFNCNEFFSEKLKEAVIKICQLNFGRNVFHHPFERGADYSKIKVISQKKDNLFIAAPQRPCDIIFFAIK